MRRIAITNLKGGSGKTCTATALAVGLARRGNRTLLVDTDPSANASWTVGAGQGPDAPTLSAVLMREASTAEAIRLTPVEGLDLLPADATLGGVNVRLAQELGATPGYVPHWRQSTRLISLSLSTPGRLLRRCWSTLWSPSKKFLFRSTWACMQYSAWSSLSGLLRRSMRPTTRRSGLAG